MEALKWHARRELANWSDGDSASQLAAVIAARWWGTDDERSTRLRTFRKRHNNKPNGLNEILR